MALHESIGPLATTISAIAKRAGVQRLTVRTHFPTASDLFKACSGLFFARNPPPDPDTWRRIVDPEERLREALTHLYAFYGRTERMLGNVTRDARVAPELVGVSLRAFVSRMRSALSSGWGVDREGDLVFQAALGHALDFTTWRSLVRDRGLRDDQAIRLMVALIGGAAAPPMDAPRVAPGAGVPGRPRA